MKISVALVGKSYAREHGYEVSLLSELLQNRCRGDQRRNEGLGKTI